MTSSTVSTGTTPQERLAISRKAIVRHMERGGRAGKNANSESWHGLDEAGQPGPAANGTWGLVKHAVLAWWRHQPVAVALSLTEPVIGRYAREQPLKLLGIAAGLGAAAVVLRPWRLVSLGGVLLATLKPSQQLSRMVLSMLATPRIDIQTYRKTP